MGDKSAARSMTIIAAVIFAVLQTLESTGVVPPGTLQELATVGKGLAGLATVFGLRRAISANGLGVLFDFDNADAFADDEEDEDYELTDADFDEPGEGEDLGDFAYEDESLPYDLPDGPGPCDFEVSP